MLGRYAELLVVGARSEGIAILELLLSVSLIEDRLSGKLSIKGGRLSLNSLAMPAL